MVGIGGIVGWWRAGEAEGAVAAQSGLVNAPLEAAMEERRRQRPRMRMRR